MFVHYQRARQVTAAGVRHPHKIERCLYGAVFALPTVQPQHHALGVAYGRMLQPSGRQRTVLQLLQLSERRWCSTNTRRHQRVFGVL